MREPQLSLPTRRDREMRLPMVSTNGNDSDAGRIADGSGPARRMHSLVDEGASDA
jgi:hypothetical protein